MRRRRVLDTYLLKIDWMTEGGMHQCIPPAYTRWIGQQLAQHLALAA